jgi:hypothetical protein
MPDDDTLLFAFPSINAREVNPVRSMSDDRRIEA